MTPSLAKLSWQLVVLIGLVLGAYVALSLAGVDPSQLVTLLLTLAGVTGVGVHQAARLSQQDEKLDRITEQTNGVLDARIRAGAGAAIREELRKLGHPIPTDPTS